MGGWPFLRLVMVDESLGAVGLQRVRDRYQELPRFGVEGQGNLLDIGQRNVPHLALQGRYVGSVKLTGQREPFL